METIFMHDSTVNALGWLTRHIMATSIHITPVQNRGIVIFQTVEHPKPGFASIDTTLRTQNVMMSAQARRVSPALGMFIDKMHLSTATPEILMSPAMASVLPKKLASINISPVVLGFDLDGAVMEYQRLTMTDPETMRTDTAHGDHLYTPYEPLGRPRVDLARCNLDVDYLDADELPHDITTQPHVDKLLNRVPERAEYQITHDMRNDVLIASWERHTTVYHVGVRLI